MLLNQILVFISYVATVHGINRPVYKVILTQKGFTQFLQYDLETPPLREFTFCTWIRTYDLSREQTIFSYVVKGNNRVLRLWIDTGGQLIKVSIDGKISSSTTVNLPKDVWRHVCFSYQSDFGAWAIYIDSKLIICETALSLYGFLIPEGGSFIIGYGTTDNGTQSGFEGEIFGATMILVSTIGRNHTLARHYLYQQKEFQQNKVRNSEKYVNYVVLSQLQTDKIQNTFEKSTTLRPLNRTKLFKYISPHSFINNALDYNFLSPNSTTKLFDDKEILDFSAADEIRIKTDKNKMNFWNFFKENDDKNKKYKEKLSPEQFVSGTKDLVMISDIETPPPPIPYNDDYSMTKPFSHSSLSPDRFHKVNQNAHEQEKRIFLQNGLNLVPDIEIPPPAKQDNKVYGQWTSTKFAGNVLNYLKSINFHHREKKAPATIPLVKYSDSYPYSSDFKINKLHPPVQFQRRKIVEPRFRKLQKRDLNGSPQINVKIVNEDSRDVILKSHAKARPKNVDIIYRGEANKYTENRFSRNADLRVSREYDDSIEQIYDPKPFTSSKMKKLSVASNFHSNKLVTILPFLKSLEYYVGDYENSESDNKQRNKDKYKKSLSNANKWHNVKTYSNDYTPRRVNMEALGKTIDMNDKIADLQDKHPAIRLKYKHDSNKLVEADDPSILKGRELALQVSNFSEPLHDSISIVKYNHGFLPSYKKNQQNNLKVRKVNGKNNFNTRVKLGNALNERHAIGNDEEQKKQSFVGGYETVPDINRYRSDIDYIDDNVPPSLRLRVCRSEKSNSHTLYVQRDESVIDSHIESPIRKKTVAIEFVHQNYKKCSVVGTVVETHSLLFIDWNNTPVRLFGGAKPKTTTDLCGFF